MGAVVALLTDGAWLSVPPRLREDRGRAAIGEFLRGIPASRDRAEIRLRSVRANARGRHSTAIPAGWTDRFGRSDFW